MKILTQIKSTYTSSSKKKSSRIPSYTGVVSYPHPRIEVYGRIVPKTTYSRHFDVASRNRKKAGDFFDILKISPDSIGLMIADSCLFAQEGKRHAKKTCFTLKNNISKARSGEIPGGIAGAFYTTSIMMRDMYKKRRETPQTRFFYPTASLLYTQIDIKNNQATATIYTAGHNFPIIYSPERRLDNLPEHMYPNKYHGLVIGTINGADQHENTLIDSFFDKKFPSNIVPLEPGSLIIQFTDGITEASKAKVELGRKGLVKIIDEVYHSGTTHPKELVLEVLNRVAHYEKDSTRNDDKSLLIAHVKEV